eukprot:757973-Hanusia_phi.AAC.1
MAESEQDYSAAGMALVTTGGTGGQLIARPGEAPLPNCLARLIQNKHQVVVDALPYIDKEYDNPHYRQAVDKYDRSYES